LQDLDRFVNEMLSARFPAGTPLRVEDWAASDCLTSAEWAASLFDVFPQAAMQASDLTLFLLELELPEGGTFILEREGEPLQYLRTPLVVQLNPLESRWFPVNRVVGQRALARLKEIRAGLTIPANWLDSASDTLTAPPYVVRKLSVVHPEAEALRLRDTRFSIKRHSAFESLAEPADVIRTMNIFNRSYFSAERLTEGARAVWTSLHPGGLWIIGRTWKDDPPTHNVSILEKTARGFGSVARYGEAAEIEALALALAADCPSG
jgi:hypothetical protein